MVWHVGYTAAEAAGPIPFAGAGNPLMAQIAFLNSIVSPAVAAAAAQRALEVKLMCPSLNPISRFLVPKRLAMVWVPMQDW